MLIKQKDHEGKEFDSQRDMCRNWGIGHPTYLYRIKHGMSLKEALTIDTGRKEVLDHNGNKYDSFNDMCMAYDKGNDTVLERLNRGWGLKEALTTPLKKLTSRVYTDHKGNKYSSITLMCTTYQIGRSLYLYRTKAGWTQEEALTTPARKKAKEKQE